MPPRVNSRQVFVSSSLARRAPANRFSRGLAKMMSPHTILAALVWTNFASPETILSLCLMKKELPREIEKRDAKTFAKSHSRFQEDAGGSSTRIIGENGRWSSRRGVFSRFLRAKVRLKIKRSETCGLRANAFDTSTPGCGSAKKMGFSIAWKGTRRIVKVLQPVMLLQSKPHWPTIMA